MAKFIAEMHSYQSLAIPIKIEIPPLWLSLDIDSDEILLSECRFV